MQMDAQEASGPIDAAKREMPDLVAVAVLVTVDWAIIAMDIRSIATGMGHRAAGIARTPASAVELAAWDKPDLIRADIQIADWSPGIDAAKATSHNSRIFRSSSQRPLPSGF